MNNEILKQEFEWPEFGNGMYFSARDVADAIRSYVLKIYPQFKVGTNVEILHGYGITLKIAPSGKFNVSELQGIPTDKAGGEWLSENWKTITNFWSKK